MPRTITIIIFVIVAITAIFGGWYFMNEFGSGLKTKAAAINNGPSDLTKGIKAVEDLNQAIAQIKVEEVSSQADSLKQDPIVKKPSITEANDKALLEVQFKELQELITVNQGLVEEIRVIKKAQNQQGIDKTQLEKEITKLSSDLRSKNRKIQKLNSQLEANRLQANKADTSRVKYLYKRLKEQLKELGLIISGQEEMIAKKDSEIAGLKLKNADLSQELFSLKGSLKNSLNNQVRIKDKLAQLSQINQNLQLSLAEAYELMLGDGSFRAEQTTLSDQEEESAGGDVSKEKAQDLKKRVEVILSN